MDIGNEKHQQFIKDLILSLHAGGDDGNSCMQSGSRSLSDSSLNPNAAEFVPSYMKIANLVNGKSGQQQQVHQQLQYQRTTPNNLNGSSTTLVDGVLEGTVICNESKEEKLGLIQHRLYKLMNQLGNQNMPLLHIQFSLTSNGNGINVQFLSPESSKQQSFDKELCESACIRMDIDEHGLKPTRPEFTLARQFLDRMGESLRSNKAQVNSPVVCSKCTGLGLKKHSYTEMEIDRQIEDIKAFEKLINEEEGARYQDAFKQLCLKLGITQNSEQPAPLKAPSEPAQRTVKEAKKEPTQENEQPRTEDNLSSYEWDPFLPELTTPKPYKQSAPDSSALVASEQKQRPEEGSEQQNQHCVLPPPVTQGITCSPPGGPTSVHSKPLEPHQTKLSNTQPASRVASNTLKDKENKTHHLRFSLPAAVTAAPAATATASGPAAVAATTATATATAANTATAAAGAVGIAGKKSQEPEHINGSRVKRSTLCPPPTKSRPKEVSASPIRKPSTSSKLEPRPSLVKTKPKLDPVHVNKPIKPATLPRAGGSRQTQENKQQSSTTTHRVMAPRSTHASQMRQSEVKRRLNLMRGEDTDVQLNEYLFK